MADKKQFLDPITSISKLILIYFKPPTTKIRIKDHTMELVEPTVFETLNRYWCSDSRNDLCVLYPVFVRFIELYMLRKCDTKEEIMCLEYLKKLSQYAIYGLK